MGKYMTTTELAELLRRSPETIRYWRYTGEGPTHFKVGRSVLYETTDVEAWLATKKQYEASESGAA